MNQYRVSDIKSKGKGHILRMFGLRTGLLASVFTVSLALFTSNGTVAQTDDGKWHFSVTPYLWIPGISGTLNFDIPDIPSGSPNMDVGSDNYLKNLDLALMLLGEARKKRWSLLTDLIYLYFSSEKSTVRSINFSGPGLLPGRTPVEIDAELDTGTRTSLKGTLWDFAVGYNMIHAKHGTLDLCGGFRYLGLDASADWRLQEEISDPVDGQVFARSGSISQSEDLWDGIIGIRGRINLGESNWFLPYRLDIGTGSSDLTWQGLLGLAYASGWVEIKLAYRHLYYDTRGDKLIDDMRFSGPGLGMTFRF